MNSARFSPQMRYNIVSRGFCFVVVVFCSLFAKCTAISFSLIDWVFCKHIFVMIILRNIPHWVLYIGLP